MDADEIAEHAELAKAMREWAAQHGKGAGLLLVEGARAIERLIAEVNVRQVIDL